MAEAEDYLGCRSMTREFSELTKGQAVGIRKHTESRYTAWPPVQKCYHGVTIGTHKYLPSLLLAHTQAAMVAGVKILAKNQGKAVAEILTDDALEFLAALHRTFDSTRQERLIARETVQQRLDAGASFDFPPETTHIRAEPSWQCAPPGPGLEDRRVEITGPPERKMVINALNSGAKTFMADFEGA